MEVETQHPVFISYSRVNKELVSRIVHGLKADGFRVWFDLLDIPTGARWDDEVEKALRDCSVFLIVLTPASIASENVKDEIGYAVDHGKRILPILLENCEIPLRLRRFQYADFTGQSFEAGCDVAKKMLSVLVNEASIPRQAISTLATVDVSPEDSQPSIITVTGEKIVERPTEKKTNSKAIAIGVVIAVLILAVGIGLKFLTPTELSSAATPSAPAKTGEITAEIKATPTENFEAQIKTANVLIYENTNNLGIGAWIQNALDGLDMRYTQTGSNNRRFMDALKSDKPYDLIIVGAEGRDASSEFWDAINTRLQRDKVALIVEIWYLDRSAYIPSIQNILSECGVEYQKDYLRAETIYLWEKNHPVFNEPNVLQSPLNSNRYWPDQAGDQIRLSLNSEAALLAGLSSDKSNQEALLASCYGGRVIIQTFSNHDYKSEDMIPLWQNYIHYTLKNHFSAIK